VTELVMDPLQFLKRLAALIPAPFQNLTRYHGIFANRSRFRSLLPLPPEALANAAQSAAQPPCCVDAAHDQRTPLDSQTSLDLDAFRVFPFVKLGSHSQSCFVHPRPTPS
jgi:hypothetical protein